MLKLSHKKLEVWNDSIEIVTAIYKLTETYPSEEKFGLVSQMRRAAVSIASNISEGAARSSRKEKEKILRNCQIFVSRTRHPVRISKAVHIVPQRDLEFLGELMNKVFAKISSMKKKA